jgi:hypothetical protein
MWAAQRAFNCALSTFTELAQAVPTLEEPCNSLVPSARSTCRAMASAE